MQEVADELYQKYLNDALDLIFDEKNGVEYKTLSFYGEQEKTYQGPPIVRTPRNLVKRSEIDFIGMYEEKSNAEYLNSKVENKKKLFEGGYARVKVRSYNGKRGPINRFNYESAETGELFNQEEYDDVLPFYYGCAVVRKGRKYSYVFADGEYRKICGYWFDDVANYNGYVFPVMLEGVAMFLDADAHPINRMGYDHIDELRNRCYKVKKDSKYGFVDPQGNLITKKWYDDIRFDYDDRIIAVRKVMYRGKEVEEYNLLDGKGNELCSEWYRSMTPRGFELYENHFMIVTNNSQKYQLINMNGNYLLDDWYDGISMVKSNDGIYGFVKKNGKENIIDCDGHIVLDDWYDEIKHFNYSGYAKVIRNTKEFNFIDRWGNPISNKWHHYGEPYFQVLDGHKNKYIDIKITDVNEIVRGYAKVTAISSNGKEYTNYLKLDGDFLFNNWFLSDERVEPYKDGIVHRTVNEKVLDNILDNNGNLILDKWQKLVHVHNINKSFAVYNVDKKSVSICKDKDLKEYTVKKTLTGYQCSYRDNIFNIKYEPIKIFDSNLILCINKDSEVNLYDRKNNKYTYLNKSSEIEFTDHIIRNERQYFLVYDGQMVDITNYYDDKVRRKKYYHINEGIKLLSKEAFFEGNEDDIRKRYKEIEEQNRRILIERENDENAKELQRIKEERELQQRKNEITTQEAVYQIEKYAKILAEISKNSGQIARIKIDDLFININSGEDKYKEINPLFIETGLLEHIDLSNKDFVNVKLSGLDFSNSNIVFYPTEVYKKDLRGCNFEGVYFPISTSFTGVDVRGARFTNDNSLATFDIKKENFADAYYDETTLLNGVPITELMKKEEKVI